MKPVTRMLVLFICVSVALFPATLFAHGGEDHGGKYHIDVTDVMEQGFQGKLNGKDAVEVVLAPDATFEKGGKAIALSDLAVGDSVLVKGAKMPGNKIGAAKVEVVTADSSAHPMHKEHEMGHEQMEQHRKMGDDHMDHEHMDH